MENLKELLEASRQLVLEVGAYIRQESAVFNRSKTETKGICRKINKNTESWVSG